MSAEISQTHIVRHVFLRNKIAVVGGGILLGIIVVAVLAPWISPMDPLEQDPNLGLKGMNRINLLGADYFGRDVLSRIIWGSRISLIVGISSVVLGLVWGITMGMAAGYFGGKTENVIMRFVDVLMSFPDLIIAVAVMAILGSNLINLIITIGIVMTPKFARLAHGTVLSVKERDYIIAAHASGVGVLRIMTRHIFPNIIGELLVAGTLWAGAVIRLEANLSFIGLGIPPPTPTWGNMIREGVDVLSIAPWISIFSGLAILVTILSLNMFGDGVRDIIDPKLRGA